MGRERQCSSRPHLGAHCYQAATAEHFRAPPSPEHRDTHHPFDVTAALWEGALSLVLEVRKLRLREATWFDQDVTELIAPRGVRALDSESVLCPGHHATVIWYMASRVGSSLADRLTPMS